MAIPFTASHSVLTVKGHSYSEMVKPSTHRYQISIHRGQSALAIDLVVLLHEEERVIVGVTMEADARSIERLDFAANMRML